MRFLFLIQNYFILSILFISIFEICKSSKVLSYGNKLGKYNHSISVLLPWIDHIPKIKYFKICDLPEQRFSYQTRFYIHEKERFYYPTTNNEYKYPFIFEFLNNSNSN